MTIEQGEAQLTRQRLAAARARIAALEARVAELEAANAAREAAIARDDAEAEIALRWRMEDRRANDGYANQDRDDRPFMFVSGA